MDRISLFMQDNQPATLYIGFTSEEWRRAQRLYARYLHKGIDVKPFRQFYSVPTTSEIAETLQAYCEQAQIFLYDNIAGLAKFDLDWTPVKPGDDFTKKYHKKIFGWRGRDHIS